MYNLRTYKQYNEKLSDDLIDKIGNDYKDLKDGLLDMIEKSLNSTDITVVNKFIDSFLEEDSESVIEGFINDSDIYEFYLKYTDSIDEILNENKFFEKSPNENAVIGLYDYLVFGTKKAVNEIIIMIKNSIN